MAIAQRPRQPKVIAAQDPAPPGWTPIWQVLSNERRIARVLRNEHSPSRMLYELWEGERHLFVEDLADLEHTQRDLFSLSPGFISLPRDVGPMHDWRTVWWSTEDGEPFVFVRALEHVHYPAAMRYEFHTRNNSYIKLAGAPLTPVEKTAFELMFACRKT